jgi:molecular chaperone GrpE
MTVFLKESDLHSEKEWSAEKEHDSELESAEVLPLEDSDTESAPQPEFRDQWLRALAEMENLRQRLEKEKKEQVRYAIRHFAKEMLAVSDNLERALKSIPEHLLDQESIQPLIQGISLTYQELEKTLEQFGIKKLSALGESFDPHYHQVVSEREEEGCTPQTVLQVLQEGYLLHDRLLRPALVVLCKK